MDNSKRDATDDEKIFKKLLYISYTCNELISNLCGTINKKGFKYISFYNFYYNVTLSYNKTINDFSLIYEDIDNRLKLKNTNKSKGDDNEDSPPINA